MKPQTKHCLVGIGVTIGLMAVLIYMERNLDGVSLSMKVVVGLIIISTLYTFLSGMNANPVRPQRNTSGPHIRIISKDSLAELPYVEMENGTRQKK